jgi:hypothetical protein
MPDIAGLRFILPQLIALTPWKAQQEAWRKMLAELPPLPTGGEPGKERLLAAAAGKRHSSHENPELYAVWPYELYGLGKKDVQVAKRAWALRSDKVNFGWNQDGIHAAMLGLTSEAKRVVVGRFGNPAADYRFPGFYGPNYDWVPDQDHATTAMLALQSMLMQIALDLSSAEDAGRAGKILLLPAWPKEWDVHFKLHAPEQTTVECRVKDGKVVELKVQPESRRNDVEICKPFVINNQRIEKCSGSGRITTRGKRHKP